MFYMGFRIIFNALVDGLTYVKGSRCLGFEEKMG